MGAWTLVLAVLGGLIPAKIAHDKGYGFWGWWLFGAALFIVATPMIILRKPLTASERAAYHEGRLTLRTLWDTLRGRG